MLGQKEAFLGMRWFESASSHLSSELAQLEAASAAALGSGLNRWIGKLSGSSPQVDPQAQNRELAASRLKTYAAEFKLLENTYTCACLLLSRT